MIFNSCCQFPIRECSCSTFTKSNITHRIQDPIMHQCINIFNPFLNLFSSFYDCNILPCTSKRISTKQARWSTSNNDNFFIICLFINILIWFNFLNLRMSFYKRIFIINFKIKTTYPMNILSPCINRLFRQLNISNCFFTNI